MKKNIVLHCLIAVLVANNIVTNMQADSVGAPLTEGFPLEGRELTIGREYYYSLLNGAAERHWAFPISVYVDFANKAFDCNGNCEPLADFIFCPDIRVRDIFLLSRLSGDNVGGRKIRNINPSPIKPANPNIPYLAAESIQLPLPFEREDAQTQDERALEFGAFGSDQFIGLVAPTRIHFDAEQREYGANFGGAYRSRPWLCEKFVTVIGANLPLKTQVHNLDLIITEGTLSREIFTPSQTGATADRFMPLRMFYREFVSIEDFVIRAVLAPKGITYKPRQRKTGFGDLSIFAYIDAGLAFEHMDSLEIGMNFVLPTGKKADCDTLWDIELGNGGLFQCNWFINGIFNTCSNALNPSFRLAAEVSASSSRGSRMRIPQRHVNPTLRRFVAEIGDEDFGAPDVDVIRPFPEFNQYFVDPFNELDSLCAAFADEAVRARVKQGSRVLVGIGNYFYNVCIRGIRLGIFYDFMHKGSDEVDVLCVDRPERFVTSKVTDCTNESWHRLGWNLTNKFRDLCEVNFGSQHIVAGTNTPKVHEVFASVIFVC